MALSFWLLTSLSIHDWFTQKRDAKGLKGLHPDPETALIWLIVITSRGDLGANGFPIVYYDQRLSCCYYRASLRQHRMRDRFALCPPRREQQIASLRDHPVHCASIGNFKELCIIHMHC